MTLDPQLTQPPLPTGRLRSADHHLTFYLPGAFTGAVHGLMERLRASIQGLASALLAMPGALHGELLRARAAFRTMRLAGCIDVGRGGALGPFSDPADLTNHLTVFSLADPPAHSRYGPHCRHRHRRSQRCRAPPLRFEAPQAPPDARPRTVFCCVLAYAARVCGSIDALGVQA